MAALGVVGVAREHRDLYRGQVLAQLRDDRLQDRLVAEVHPAIGTGNSYAKDILTCGHGRSLMQKRYPRTPAGRNAAAAGTVTALCDSSKFPSSCRSEERRVGKECMSRGR